MPTQLEERPQIETLPRMTGASVIQDGRYMPPPKDHDGRTWIRASVAVMSSAETLYAMWSDVESSAAWREEIVEIVKIGPKTSRWTMRHGDKTIQWDSEVLADEPGKRIAWRSTSGEIDQAGEVIFEPAPGGRGTIVTVLQSFHTGKLANLLATLTGRNPKQAVIEDLRHFKALAETGEIPRSQQDPHGDRGIIGGLKRSLYGETIPTPRG